jgi:hypothetical protein
MQHLLEALKALFVLEDFEWHSTLILSESEGESRTNFAAIEVTDVTEKLRLNDDTDPPEPEPVRPHQRS